MAARARKVQGASHASSLLALTQRAIKCRSAALHHAPDRAGAAWGRARLAGAIIDAEIVLKIAELGHDPLIRERRLKRSPFPFARAREQPRVELVAKGLGAERAQQRLPVKLGAGNELHHPEAARIIEGNTRARRHME